MNENIEIIEGTEAGQTMAEYAVVLAVITAAAAGVFLLLGNQVTDSLNAVIGIMAGQGG